MFTWPRELVFVADLEVLRALFIKSYAGVPTKLRTEIIALVDENPYNWDTAYLEIKGKTQIGDKLLRHLEEIKVLHEE